MIFRYGLLKGGFDRVVDKVLKHGLSLRCKACWVLEEAAAALCNILEVKEQKIVSEKKLEEIFSSL